MGLTQSTWSLSFLCHYHALVCAFSSPGPSKIPYRHLSGSSSAPMVQQQDTNNARLLSRNNTQGKNSLPAVQTLQEYHFLQLLGVA
jgi:hypothetical protein